MDLPDEPGAAGEPIGSGPFKFSTSEFKPGLKVVYEKNKDYVARSEPPSSVPLLRARRPSRRSPDRGVCDPGAERRRLLGGEQQREVEAPHHAEPTGGQLVPQVLGHLPPDVWRALAQVGDPEHDQDDHHRGDRGPRPRGDRRAPAGDVEFTVSGQAFAFGAGSSLHCSP